MTASGMAARNNVSLTKLQSLNGVFAIYKKTGPTSADVLNTLKQKLLKEAGVNNSNPRKRKQQVIKLGHGGTLDSAASGVLVVGIGEGTKMLTSMLSGSKRYTAVGELGKETDSFDATGNVVQEKSYDHVTKEAFEEKLKQFTGDIMQVPPLYSALKKDGKRLSTLLKEGHEVEAKPARPVTVYSLSLQDFKPPLFTLDLSFLVDAHHAAEQTFHTCMLFDDINSMELHQEVHDENLKECFQHLVAVSTGRIPDSNVECGGGFYVRSLVHDLGKELSTCAHVRDLTRTKQGQFTLQEHVLREERWTFQDISEVLQPCPKPAAVQKLSKKSRTQDAASQLDSECAAKHLKHDRPVHVGEEHKQQ